MNQWTVKVQEDPESGDVLIEFPDDLLAKVGWQAGDTIKWMVDEATGSCHIVKVDDPTDSQ